ncbi:hypothetical protein GOODEAATRI_000693 [Goodea atripinnis]|uniref:Mitogen-activated protein kinase-binding protein 1 n=1 Tax=Goodea atripinnis TaxID=208336 RepID=A0ABV0NI06_9TELE
MPLLGRSGLLGELRNNFFSDVSCGRGSKSDSTFCITSSGLLCEFNSKRMLDKWVDLRSVSLSEDMIFCGCADGTVRAFSPVDLHFVSTLPRPHPLGSDVSAVTEASHLFNTKTEDRCPDVIAVTYDPVNRWLSCVYNDHSLYVWDVREDLLKIIYIDGNTGTLLDPECNVNTEKSGDVQTAEIKAGIRTICVSPDGKHLASGDRNGMLRINVQSQCIDMVSLLPGLKLLATASRDRLIHVLDADDSYSLVQTLGEHSSSITAVRFAGEPLETPKTSDG